jgi:diguanylate cyclase (GGDEF)-like protein
VGDKMLREMGRIIQTQLREYDFLARYAGDEFVAIVQELVGNQVEDLRSRIETAVSEFSLHVRGGGQARVGISIGTATYGVEGETLDQLLVAADQAMYRAKSSHKLDKISRRTAPSAEIIELENDNLVQLENDNLASVSVN